MNNADNNLTINISEEIKPYLSEIFILISKYQKILENIQNELLSQCRQNDLNIILQQTFYIITNNKDKMTLGDLYRFLTNKKIFFNLSNLSHAFITYDKDNDSFLTMTDFSNIFNFPINSNKFISKTEPNSNIIRIIIKYLLKDFEFFEMLNNLLKQLYKINKNFNATGFFNTISLNKTDLSLEDIQKVLNDLGIIKDSLIHSKYILMKITNNVVENINLEQFVKYFTIINSNTSKLKTDSLNSSSFLNSSQLTCMLNQAIEQTQQEYYPKKIKMEYEMFYTYIKFVIDKDKKLSNILQGEQFFNSATLFNYLSNYKDMTLDTFLTKLQMLFQITTDRKTLSNIFERYSSRGYYMSYTQFNKLMGLGVNNIDFQQTVESYELFPQELKNKINLSIQTAIKNEIDIENFRKKLNKMSHFNLRDIFNSISQGNSYITTFDLEDYFGIDKEQSSIVMKRFDKDDDGKISYDDVSFNYFLYLT